jgi:glycine dehydrogenase subunit 1
VAEASLRGAHYAFERLTALDGIEPMFPGGPFFKEFALRTERPARELIEAARARGVLAGIALDRFQDVLPVRDGLLVAVTEKRSKEEIDLLVSALSG